MNKPDMPPLPKTDWLLHMPGGRYEPEWTSSQEGYSADDMRAYGAACAAAEREEMSMLLSDALSALDYHQEQTRPIHSTKVAIDAIRTTIRARGEN